MGAPRSGARNPRFIAPLNRPADSVRLISFIELGSEHGLKVDVNRLDGVTQRGAYARANVREVNNANARTRDGIAETQHITGPIMFQERLPAMLGWEWERETPPLTYMRLSIFFWLANRTNEERPKGEGCTGIPNGEHRVWRCPRRPPYRARSVSRKRNTIARPLPQASTIRGVI